MLNHKPANYVFMQKLLWVSMSYFSAWVHMLETSAQWDLSQTDSERSVFAFIHEILICYMYGYVHWDQLGCEMLMR